jgi:hypothetical protein
MWCPAQFPPRLLLRTGDVYENMACTEFACIAEAVGSGHVTIEEGDRLPYVHVRGLSSQQACDALFARSILSMQLFEVYGEGATYEEMIENIDW